MHLKTLLFPPFHCAISCFFKCKNAFCVNLSYKEVYSKKKGDTDHAILFLALQFGSFSPDLLPFTLTINSIFMLISELCFWTFLYLYLLKPLFCSLSGRTSKQGVFKVRFAPYTCRADPVVLAIRLKL